jgi:hypothetical protein
MGSSASISSLAAEVEAIQVTLKKLPDAIEESLYVHEKFPLIVDSTEQGSRFLKYQMGSFINADDPVNFNKNALNRALVGALQHGRTMTIKFRTLKAIDESLFEPNLFPREVMNRQKFYSDEVWRSVIKPELGDPDPAEVSISPDFAFIICTISDEIPLELAQSMKIIKVVDQSGTTAAADGTGNSGNGGAEDMMEQMASLFGATEIIRFDLLFESLPAHRPHIISPH